MRTRKEIIDGYNDYVNQVGNGIVGNGMTANINIMLTSNRVIVELLLDIRDAVNKVPGCE